MDEKPKAPLWDICRADSTTLDTKAGLGSRLTLVRPGAHCKQEGQMNKACKSLICFAVVKAKSKIILSEINFIPTVSMGSNG